jgi:hypothetical protein
MELTRPTVSDLFAQLGLPNQEADIRAFIGAHRPMDGGALLADAPFWSPAQGRFLRDEIVEDAD